MTLTLNLPTDLEAQLSRSAEQKGLTAEAYAAQLLEEQLRQERIERNQAAIRLLQSWIDEGDEEEQRETFEALKKGLEENRLSNRPLFPPRDEGE
jgi:regulator of protease activity HflC (stomatin/prohibitin superfamily)